MCRRTGSSALVGRARTCGGRPTVLRAVRFGVAVEARLLARDVALVALGGALGAVARFGVSTALPRIVFPWHTLLVNLAGAFILGALFLDKGMEHTPRLLWAVGFLGAFTTLSTFGVETVSLWRASRPTLALANMAANGFGGPAMAWLGWRLLGR